MNICFFALEHHALGSGGGIASYLDVLTTELARLGHEIHIIAKGKTHKSILLEKGIFLHEFRGGNIHWYLSKVPFIGQKIALPLREIEWSLGYYRRFKGLKEKYSFDLIESSETGNLLTALFEKSVPVVIRLHGSTYSFEQATRKKPSLGATLDRVLQRISFRRTRGISAPSKFQKRMFEAEMGERFGVAIIPNPVKYAASAPYQKVGEDKKRFIFFAGRIADVKGAWTLLKAFVHIAADDPEACLVMAGPPHVSVSSNAVQNFLAYHHIADRVEFVGHIQRDKIGEYYQRCTVYVIPSYYETFSISAIEAMLHGKPVVGTSGTALDEIIDDGETGLLVPPGDDEALADAIAKLLRDDQLACRIGEEGKQKALERFGPEMVAGETVAFYESILSGVKSGGATVS